MPGAFLVGQLDGGIFEIKSDAQGHWSKSVFAQLRVGGLLGNDGLLGLAFHPRFAENRKYYVYSISDTGQSLLEERTADASLEKDAGASRPLLRLTYTGVVHNGGDLHFGPDGYLYLGVGDQGNPLVYNARSQDLSLLAGKMLRIDVDRKDAGMEYAIPPDNPFMNAAGARKEIWAYGLRQPWRWTFDAADGSLIVGDVGDWIAEEVDVVTRGGNYGWSRREGNTCFNGEDELHPLTQCDTADLIAPSAVLLHEPVSTAPTSCIIGGQVFRGDPASAFFGAYIFGDYETRKVYAVRLQAGRLAEPQEIGSAPSGMSSFSMDANGNLYLVGYNSGLIYRIAHPGLAGKGVAVLPRIGNSHVTGRPIEVGRIDSRAFPGAEKVELFSLQGKRLRGLGAAELANGVDPGLPRGVYPARVQRKGAWESFPVLLR